MPKNTKIFSAAIILIAACLALAWPFRLEIANLPARLLVRDDDPEKQADFILIMMGSVIDRADHAASLFKQQYAKKIVFAEAEETEMVKQGYRMRDGEATYDFLLKAGITSEDIVFLSEARNTSSREEVDMILNHLRENFPETRRIILVTSWYHSSRAAWILERVDHHGFQLQSKPTRPPQAFWQREDDFLRTYVEYLKWLYYLIKY